MMTHPTHTFIGVNFLFQTNNCISSPFTEIPIKSINTTLPSR